MSNMIAPPTDQTNPNPDPTPIRFPPVPLLSGDSFDSEDGETHRLATVTVIVTATDGTTIEIPLEYRFGGWWSPNTLPDQ